MIKPYEYYLEKVQKTNEDVSNTEKETKLKNHEKKMEYYKSNKDKFSNIFSNDEENWEEKAEEIIDGNIYLNYVWKIEKIKNKITELENKIREGELSDEEADNIESQISENEEKIDEEQDKLDKKISEDLSEIKSL